jgi:endonuclease G
MKTSKFHGLFLLITVLLFSFSYLHADYLEVSRNANLKQEPLNKSTLVAKLTPGKQLKLISDEQYNGYYHAYSPSLGKNGYIYRTFVRRIQGDMPRPQIDPDDDPMRDRSNYETIATKEYASRHLALGKPQAVFERSYEGFCLAQDGRLKIPLWVQYQLSPDDLVGPAKRRDNFHTDTSIPEGYRATKSDYSGSGKDMGHQAPAAHMTRSQDVMDESFLLSNMAPQEGVGFNRHIWRYLEAACMDWCEARGTLTIITGPIFNISDNHVSYNVVGKNQVAVPTHFYKIVVDNNDSTKPSALAFVLPNEALTGEKDFSKYLVSIDEIEQKTGLDFLNALPVAIQENIEEQPADALW